MDNKEKHTSAFSKDIFVWEQFCDLIASFKRDIIIETGTYLGQSTVDFCKLGIPVHTVEKRQDYQNKAKKLCKGANNIRWNLGDSSEFLNNLLPRIKKRHPIMFLDAHWYKDNCLERELQVLAREYSKSDYNKPVLVMHDFKVPGHPEFGFDEYEGRPFQWEWVKPYADKIFGGTNYDRFYNKEKCPTANQDRGVLFLTPKKWK